MAAARPAAPPFSHPGKSPRRGSGSPLSGRLPGYKVGQEWVVRLEDVEAWEALPRASRGSLGGWTRAPSKLVQLLGSEPSEDFEDDLQDVVEGFLPGGAFGHYNASRSQGYRVGGL
jgi:hypothetical protein